MNWGAWRAEQFPHLGNYTLTPACIQYSSHRWQRQCPSVSRLQMIAVCLTQTSHAALFRHEKLKVCYNILNSYISGSQHDQTLSADNDDRQLTSAKGKQFLKIFAGMSCANCLIRKENTWLVS